MKNTKGNVLLLIDIQHEYVSGKLPIEFPSLEISIPNIQKAISIAKKNHIPIVVVEQHAPAQSPIFATNQLGARSLSWVQSCGAELTICKSLPSAFSGTNLQAWLRMHDIKTITVVGFMTQNCVDSTIREACHLGYAVEFLHDASGTVSFKNKMGTLSAKQMHEATCIILQSRFAAVMTTQEWGQSIDGNQSPRRESILESYETAE